MRASELISITPILEQAIEAINNSFEREKQSQKISAEFDEEYKRLLALTKDDSPTTGLGQSSTTQQPRVRLSRPKIEGFYPWRHRVVLAANALAECKWTIEARAIHEELNKLPTHQVDWAQPGARDDLRDEIQAVGTRIRDVLTGCVTEIQASNVQGKPRRLNEVLEPVEASESQYPPSAIDLALCWSTKPRNLGGPTKDQATFVDLLIKNGGLVSHADLSVSGGFDWEDPRKGATNMAKRINIKLARHAELWSIIPEDNSRCLIALNSELETRS
jgi:hypothetical protein